MEDAREGVSIALGIRKFFLTNLMFKRGDALQIISDLKTSLVKDASIFADTRQKDQILKI